MLSTPFTPGQAPAPSPRAQARNVLLLLLSLGMNHFLGGMAVALWPSAPALAPRPGTPGARGRGPEPPEYAHVLPWPLAVVALLVSGGLWTYRGSGCRVESGACVTPDEKQSAGLGMLPEANPRPLFFIVYDTRPTSLASFHSTQDPLINLAEGAEVGCRYVLLLLDHVASARAERAGRPFISVDGQGMITFQLKLGTKMVATALTLCQQVMFGLAAGVFLRFHIADLVVRSAASHWVLG